MKIAIILLVIVLVTLVSGFVFLSSWDIPPPAEQVEKVILHEKLSR
jgi:hypothetical protein